VDIIPASSATPGSNQGKSTIIGTIILLSTPPTISRQIKSVFIRNRNTTTSNTVSIINKVVEYLLTGDILLQAGATITYESNIG
jgi:hypothetical protein